MVGDRGNVRECMSNLKEEVEEVLLGRGELNERRLFYQLIRWGKKKILLSEVLAHTLMLEPVLPQHSVGGCLSVPQ